MSLNGLRALRFLLILKGNRKRVYSGLALLGLWHGKLECPLAEGGFTKARQLLLFLQFRI